MNYHGRIVERNEGWGYGGTYRGNVLSRRDTRYGDSIYTTTQIQFAWNSNHKENTLTAKQTAQLFATGTYTDGEQVNPDDALETRNHFAAFVGFSTMLMSRWTGIWSVPTCMPFSSRAPDRSDSLFNVGGATRLGRTVGNLSLRQGLRCRRMFPNLWTSCLICARNLRMNRIRYLHVHWTLKIHPFSDGNGRSDSLSCSRSFAYRCVACLSMTRIVRSTSMAST